MFPLGKHIFVFFTVTKAKLVCFVSCTFKSFCMIGYTLLLNFIRSFQADSFKL